ncbi:MinD/ParA family protein [Microbacterium sp. VKM Ac-2923]|uniref:MinD/ParA family ATP-binding protein n=1 Tax=Microbacterium sp. VKM Ac-2923 TaxID=2929476 RepID=UPI001FB47945|nr:MinD/ParA family protein [Microbacterium sp. VKM Ac-2923]MCJ1708002.1 MinD/ParA family protein [Microbacterium sp. VKM Ac-2923]
MTPDRTDANPDENAEHGVLDESGNLDTASITILGGHIAQVNVDLPVATDDDVDDDDVIDDEIPVDGDPPLLDAPHDRRPDASGEIAHTPHVEMLPTGDIILEPHDDAHDDASSSDGAHHDVRDADVVDDVIIEHRYEPEEATGDRDADLRDAGIVEAVELVEADAAEPIDDLELVDDADFPDAADTVADADTEVTADTVAGADTEVTADADVEAIADADTDVDAVADADGDVDEAVNADENAAADGHADADRAELASFDAANLDRTGAAGDASGAANAPEGSAGAVPPRAGDGADTALTHAPWVPAPAQDRMEASDAGAPTTPSFDDRADDRVSVEVERESAIEPDTAPKEDDVASTDEHDDRTEANGTEGTTEASGVASVVPEPNGPVPEAAPPVGSAEPSTAPVTGPVPATDVTPASGPVPTTRAERAATGAIGTIPLTRRGVHQADDAARAADEAARVDRAHAMERVRTPAPDVTLTSKRIGQIDDARESSDLLTADRLLDPRQISKPEPEGLWQQLVYSVSRHRINLGDGRRARQRKELDHRIAAPLSGGARFVPVLSRKGGVGKTTVTSLLGMALADARDDRIIAVDANPDRGTLADRVGRPNGSTVRDLVRAHEEVAGFNDISSIVARDATRLDVLASDADPRVSEAFSDDDYRRVADVAAHYYSIVLTDTGTGIVHSVMGATLELADTIVIVAGLSVDEARLASETLTWLETNGYSARVRDAVVVLNNSRPGTPLVRESELEAHFRSRVRTVIRMPYDARIAAGSAITFRDLQPSTRQAARELAAAVVEGLRSPAAAA